MIGKTLGHYQIAEKLGAGGMGEVYQAEDTNLSRQVAIKVLPDEFAQDAERLVRFQREARVLASLNHPNIATLYGLEESEGNRFIVMELVEGQTLAHRLLKGPLLVDEALDVCRQIAEGLEAAHEKAVVHRDLKPGNVMLTTDDKVKILDFGLAKAMAGESQSTDATHSPTITEAVTRPGIILGTAAYMSPEQARGKPVDKRADIWAFGCILFECLTGKRAFQGETITETVASILKSEPDWTLLPAETSSSVRAVLRRCLQKDPTLRLHDIADARIEIGERVLQVTEEVGVHGALPSRWLLAWSVVAPIAGAFVAVALMWHFRPVPSPTVTRAIIKTEPGYWLAGMGMLSDSWRPSRTAMVISSGARFIVYGATEGNPDPQAVSRLFLRRLDQMTAKPIAGTEGGISPFLSPDDKWIGFWAAGKLKKISVDGGVPVILCDGGPWPFGASWGPDNNIMFSTGEDTGIFRISADGGKAEALTTPDRKNQEYGHRLPHCLPDGNHVLFTISREAWDHQSLTAVLDLKTRKWRALLEDAGDTRYIPTGHLVFLRRGTLMAVPFDLNRLEVRGQPVPVEGSVMQASNSIDSRYHTCAGQFSFSDSGWLTYVAGGVVPDVENSLVWTDKRGTVQPIASSKVPFSNFRLAPDGQRIAYTTTGAEWRLHVYDLARGTESALTSDGKCLFLLWTTDGKRLIFNWWKSGIPNLYLQPADGSSPMERLTTSDYEQDPSSLTPDGNTLAFVEGLHPKTGWDILLLDLQSRRVTPLLNTQSGERHPMFSPDGRWLAYTSDESGREEVYVRPFPGPGGKWKLSLEGGSEPLWARNGQQLFYRWQNQVWEVDVRTDTNFTPGRPRLLSDQPGYGALSDPVRGWDISTDGQRFLRVKPKDMRLQPVNEIILVQNWLEELKRLVPTGR